MADALFDPVFDGASCACPTCPPTRCVPYRWRRHRMQPATGVTVVIDTTLGVRDVSDRRMCNAA